MAKVIIDDTEIVFECDDGQTVLEAAKQAGYELPYSCRNGVCGSCKGVLKEGGAEFGGSPEALTEEELANGWVLFCQTKPTTDIRIKVTAIERVDPDAVKKLRAKLYKLERVAEDVSILSLRFPAGIRAKFKAGQYLNIRLANGAIRSYSMASPAHQTDSIQLHVRHVPGGSFSAYLEDTANVGDYLDLELPFGSFYLREAEKPLLFVVSGTGFAPVKSIIETLIKVKFPLAPVYLYWGGRRKVDVYLASLAQKWASRFPNFNFVPVLSEEKNGLDREGLVHNAVLEDFPSLEDFDVYVCGVPAMVNAARRDFIQFRKLPADRFFCDAFVMSPKL
ncbi:MAG: 2Fe-2S iron-sulfur cluster binding domain-containing protein [Pusillimonas sp.]|jgi:NAD(P)H-flavin reductase/ferredoxin|nr:2Fe-2S iron-sulfur cluster binding domain-containing protein [Pusillimonas sp.]